MEKENSFSLWFHVLKILFVSGFILRRFTPWSQKKRFDPVSSSWAIFFVSVTFSGGSFVFFVLIPS
ncbi:hypothetical protein DLM78_09930 [Leptospira stimsonii]|uniref:Uncharacterized protein n=1 Tax=Leptospira stimsonii TaxID=2202203 RepID=A0A8B6RYG6_9LEPT|nr:hypothetical protein DLM78_09930 [Leptospira stimsonii]